VALRIALDTNRFSDLGRGDAELELLLERAEAVYLPFVVVAELRAGGRGRAGILHPKGL
jgi:predicted nucleic acid-binding protein